MGWNDKRWRELKRGLWQLECSYAWLLELAPSHIGFKVSRDSEQPMTNGKVEFNRLEFCKSLVGSVGSYVLTLLDIISFYCTTHP